MVDSNVPGGDRSQEDAVIQRDALAPGGAAPTGVEAGINAARGAGGEQLAQPARANLENRLGVNLANVRIHRDARAAELANAVSARAFTVNSDIFFGKDQYEPRSTMGLHLLAHEVAHTLQQRDDGLSRQVLRRAVACSAFSSYDASKALTTYNCAGLATRTYALISPASAAVTAIGNNFNNPTSASSCPAGSVKFWLWEYDLWLEDSTGKRISPASPDFHIVAGVSGAGGADPTSVWSKNGKRKVYGPASGPSWRPATRERALSNDPTETPVTDAAGNPVYKGRANFVESTFCAECA